MKKKILSILLCLALLATILPAAVFADGYNSVVSVENGTSRIKVVVTSDAAIAYTFAIVNANASNDAAGYGASDTDGILAAALTAVASNDIGAYETPLGVAPQVTVTVTTASDGNGGFVGSYELTADELAQIDDTITTTEDYLVVGYAAGSTGAPIGNKFTLNSQKKIPVNYTVSFNVNEGTVADGGSISNVTYDGSQAVSQPTETLTRTGYRFNGWSTTKDDVTTKVSFPYTPSATVELFALWTKVYDVSFDLNGGTKTGEAIAAQSKAAGESVALPGGTGLSKTGYTFAGWNTTDSATSALPSYALPNDASADVTLYAVWTAIPVTLTASNITVKTNNAVNVTLPEATPTDGYSTTFTYTAAVKSGDTLPAGLTLSTNAPFTLTGTPTAEGEATIEYTAKDDTNGASTKVEIKVTVSDKDPASILGVPTSTVEGKVGGGVTPVITTNSTSPLTFKSSDEAVVTVDANGKLTFVAEGEAVITVSVAEDATYAEASKTYNVKVGPAVTAEPHDAFMFGYEGTKSFGPDDQLTRAQAVTILARLDGWKDGQEVKVDEMFPDVKNIWYYNAIAYAKKAGIVEGFEDGTFQPDKPITRAEFSKMLARMANEGKDPTGTSSALSDAKEHWANVWIGYLETSFPGSIGGREDGLFHPNDDITRAETAKIVNGYLGRLQSVSAKEADQLAADLNKFDDVKRCTWYYNNVMEATVNHESTTEKFHTAD